MKPNARDRVMYFAGVVAGLMFVALFPFTVRGQAPAADPPPKTALILKLQEQLLELQDENGRLTRENAALKRVLLDEARKSAAADILKEWNGKPGEVIDWQRLQKVMIASAPPKDDKKPAETKQP